MEVAEEAREVLDFWFRELAPSDWFSGREELDRLISERFGGTLRRARAGEFDGWADTPRGCLALIILLDQFSRQVFRGRVEAFSCDAKAQALTLEADRRGWAERLTFEERHFLYMPLMHAEDTVLQELSVSRFRQLAQTAGAVLDFALEHRATVQRFGRFPARDAVLGRSSPLNPEPFG